MSLKHLVQGTWDGTLVWGLIPIFWELGEDPFTPDPQLPLLTPWSPHRPGPSTTQKPHREPSDPGYSQLLNKQVRAPSPPHKGFSLSLISSKGGGSITARVTPSGYGGSGASLHEDGKGEQKG